MVDSGHMQAAGPLFDEINRTNGSLRIGTLLDGFTDGVGDFARL